jgi:glyoxylase I family protein
LTQRLPGIPTSSIFRSKQTVSVAGLSFGFLYPAGDYSFHFELMAGAGAAERPAYKDLHDSYNMSGRHRPGFSVDSVDAVIDELKSRGVTIASEPHDVPAMGLRVAFFADHGVTSSRLSNPSANKEERIGAQDIQGNCAEGF